MDVRHSILLYAGFSPPAPATSSLARGTSGSENGSGHFVAPVQLPGQGSGDLAPASKPFSPNHAAPNSSPFQPQTSSQVNFLRCSLLGGELTSVSFYCGITECILHSVRVCGINFNQVKSVGCRHLSRSLPPFKMRPSRMGLPSTQSPLGQPSTYLVRRKYQKWPS